MTNYSKNHLYPLERHMESEGHEWVNAKTKIRESPQTIQQIRNMQILNLQNICLVDRSWIIESQFSGYSWVWINGYMNKQLLG